MLRHFSGPIVKALLLGFFCCLGAEAKDANAKEPKAEVLSLRKVHPNNTKLLAEIKAGTRKVVPGYKIFQKRVSDPETGKIIGKEPILLALKTIVNKEYVALASPGEGLGVVNVTLTKTGGERLTKATKKMQIGIDRIAVVLREECIIAPTVNAVLGRRFIIEGLDGRDEVDLVIRALKTPLKK